jgi:hypothetical protein
LGRRLDEACGLCPVASGGCPYILCSGVRCQGQRAAGSSLRFRPGVRDARRTPCGGRGRLPNDLEVPGLRAGGRVAEMLGGARGRGRGMKGRGRGMKGGGRETIGGGCETIGAG